MKSLLQRLFVIVAICGSITAHAALYKFDVSEGGVKASFFMDSRPTPTAFEQTRAAKNFNVDGPCGFYVDGDGRHLGNFNLRVYSSQNLGGLDLESSQYDAASGTYVADGPIGLFTSGDVLYTGPVSQPKMMLGTFEVADWVSGNATYTVKVTDVTANAATIKAKFDDAGLTCAAFSE